MGLVGGRRQGSGNEEIISGLRGPAEQAGYRVATGLLAEVKEIREDQSRDSKYPMFRTEVKELLPSDDNYCCCWLPQVKADGETLKYRGS